MTPLEVIDGERTLWPRTCGDSIGSNYEFIKFRIPVIPYFPEILRRFLSSPEENFLRMNIYSQAP